MIKKKITAAGLRLTPQRLAILEFLKGNSSHPSAEDIYHGVKSRYPAISFATIYNTLEKLKALGGVRELTIDSSRRRYDPDTTPHHHLVCRSCGRIVDIHADYQLDLPEHASQEFEVVATHVEFIGRCRPCGGAAAPLSNTIDGGRR